MLSEVFWSFFLTSSIGCIMGILRMVYKSKCKSCSFCGLKIERDIITEAGLDEIEMQKVKGSEKNNIN
jgi:hypothetical protein